MFSPASTQSLLPLRGISLYNDSGSKGSRQTPCLSEYRVRELIREYPLLGLTSKHFGGHAPNSHSRPASSFAHDSATPSVRLLAPKYIVWYRMLIGVLTNIIHIYTLSM